LLFAYGNLEVDYHFPTLTMLKMAKMPFVPDPRYSDSAPHQYWTQAKLKEDISSTQRQPYPRAHEIALPRGQMV